MEEKYKTVIKKFNKKIMCRNPNKRDELPDRNEIGMFMNESHKKGYCILKSSLSVRKLAPTGPIYPIGKVIIWGWFMYFGKNKVGEHAMYDKERNYFYCCDNRIGKTDLVDFALSKEAKEILNTKNSNW